MNKANVPAVDAEQYMPMMRMNIPTNSAASPMPRVMCISSATDFGVKDAGQPVIVTQAVVRAAVSDDAQR